MNLSLRNYAYLFITQIIENVIFRKPPVTLQPQTQNKFYHYQTLSLFASSISQTLGF